MIRIDSFENARQKWYVVWATLTPNVGRDIMEWNTNILIAWFLILCHLDRLLKFNYYLEHIYSLLCLRMWS
jgi:hypothetical protein